MALANLVSIVATAPSMAIAGSAKNEMTARVGMIGGMFFKRFIMLFWALAGLLAIALYAGKLHDPDLIWGHMTFDLLFPGAIGLMLAGILAANMSSLDALSVSNSALFIRNLYQPLVPGKSERHYINVGRIVILIIMLGGVGTAVMVDNLLDLFKYFISIPAVFGAAIWLGFLWRRLTRWAVILQVLICFTVYAIIPNLFQTLDSVCNNPGFLLETRPKEVMITTGALTEDVEEERAMHVGQSIQKRHVIEPTGVFFDKVVRRNPKDPLSPKTGQGRFHAEIWILSWFGIDFSKCSKAQLVATRFFFDALFPFVLLFLVSAVTRPGNKKRLDRFYGKLHTPVQPTPEKEKEALDYAAEHPEIHEKKKLLPGTNWEILKPTRLDLAGFGGSWVLVGVVIFLLWVLARWGA
jgi:SSS family solute:Na+ symporter